MHKPKTRVQYLQKINKTKERKPFARAVAVQQRVEMVVAEYPGLFSPLPTKTSRKFSYNNNIIYYTFLIIITINYVSILLFIYFSSIVVQKSNAY